MSTDSYPLSITQSSGKAVRSSLSRAASSRNGLLQLDYELWRVPFSCLCLSATNLEIRKQQTDSNGFALDSFLTSSSAVWTSPQCNWNQFAVHYSRWSVSESEKQAQNCATEKLYRRCTFVRNQYKIFFGVSRFQGFKV